MNIYIHKNKVNNYSKWEVALTDDDRVLVRFNADYGGFYHLFTNEREVDRANIPNQIKRWALEIFEERKFV
ncbi:hypothetical protein [Tuberibacillus sp. Marseille-P3662]|uniref:hypothetical protein n=1 Tax=Tuberibacillus sp. Marseille-P3662 TaxID=1965358 RepID=UPI000A1CB4FD|nr:hypothetical protein [Tuberibacillus sp. Marseille-P3662]